MVTNCKLTNFYKYKKTHAQGLDIIDKNTYLDLTT